MSGVVAIECGSLPLISASDLALNFEAAYSSLDVLEPKTTLGKRVVSQAEKTCGTILMHVMASYCWAMSNARCCDILGLSGTRRAHALEHLSAFVQFLWMVRACDALASTMEYLLLPMWSRHQCIIAELTSAGLTRFARKGYSAACTLST